MKVNGSKWKRVVMCFDLTVEMLTIDETCGNNLIEAQQLTADLELARTRGIRLSN